MKTKKQNKGVAMVVALIAILFISVLASSLLYMTVLNNQMKSMRRFSTDNFYTAEYALNDMLSQLKQYSSIQADPRGTLKSELNDSGSVNTAKLQELIGVSDYMSEMTITVENAYTGNFSETSSSLWLKGVRIIAETDEEHGSLRSSIVTDIELRFPETTSNKGKLNDFSILSDSPIYIVSSSQYFCGDLYCRKNGNTTIGANNAFRVGGDAIVNVLSTFAFFDGDLVIDDQGSLFLSGATYVNGNVTISAPGSLNIGGALYVKGTITGPYHMQSGATVKTGGDGVDWDFYADNYPDGLACKVLADGIQLHVGASTTMDIPSPFVGKQYNFTMTQAQFARMVSNNEYTADHKTKTKTTVNGHDVYAIYETNQVEHDYKNSLVLSAVPLTNFHGKVENSTMINILDNDDGLLYIGDTQQHANGWGTMDDADYEAALDMVFCCETAYQVAGSTMTFGPWDTSISGLYHPEGESETNKFKLGDLTLYEYTSGTDQPAHYYYEDGNHRHNVFPFRNLIADDVDIRLGEFLGGTSGSGGGAAAGAQPKVFLYNWTKE